MKLEPAALDPQLNANIDPEVNACCDGKQKNDVIIIYKVSCRWDDRWYSIPNPSTTIQTLPASLQTRLDVSVHDYLVCVHHCRLCLHHYYTMVV